MYACIGACVYVCICIYVCLSAACLWFSQVDFQNQPIHVPSCCAGQTNSDDVWQGPREPLQEAEEAGEKAWHDQENQASRYIRGRCWPTGRRCRRRRGGNCPRPRRGQWCSGRCSGNCQGCNELSLDTTPEVTHGCIERCLYYFEKVYMYAYTFIYARVWVYICTRVGAFRLFVPSNLYTTCACITGVSYTCTHVCGGIGSGFCFSLFMVSACYWRGRLCFGRGRDRGFVLYISLFLQVLGWWVCVCLYSCVHTHKLLGYLMWAQVWDRHLESQKNPDRLKRIIHVDRIGVHITFVYIYAALRILMIWANCFFLSTRLVFLEK